MSKRKVLDLSSIELVLALANTPSFVIRKLLQDPAVEVLSGWEENVLVDELQRCIFAKNKTPRQRVFPYAAIVALALKRAMKPIATFGRRKTDHIRWFKEICAILQRNYSSVELTRIEASRKISLPSRASEQSRSSNNYTQIVGRSG